jgi:hypothetical protein
MEKRLSRAYPLFLYLDHYQSLMSQSDTPEQADARTDRAELVEFSFPTDKWALLHRLVPEESMRAGHAT